MASLSPPARPRALTTSTTSSDRTASGSGAGAILMGAPANPSPSLIQGNIGQLGTMIDLLNASAHDPDHHHSDSEAEGDSEAEAEVESDTTTDSPRAPSSPSHPHTYIPSHHHHDGDDSDQPHSQPRPRPPPPKRGDSLYNGKNPLEQQLALDLALDGIESVDDAIRRAQETEESEGFKDPKDETMARSGEEMLATLVEEFGPWTDDTEEFIMQIPGALYRGVLIKGLLALTNRRFFVYAFIPPPESTDKIIKAGPVTIHYPSRFTKKRRSWIELRSDSVTWFASSSKAIGYKPIGSCRLSQYKEMRPYDDTHPRQFTIELVDGRERTFELDTEESAIQWRSEVEAAVFMFRTTADKLRLSLPLQYITRTMISPFQALAVKVELEFDTITPCSALRAQTEAEQDTASFASEDSRTTTSFAQTIEFGYLKSHSTFSDALVALVDAAKDLPPCGGSLPILEIDSEVRSKDADRKKVISEDSSLAAQFCRLFALGDDPKDLFVATSVELVRTLPAWGSLAISSVFVCFWRKNLVGLDTLLRIPLVDIDDVVPVKAFGFRIFGLAIQIHGAPDCRLDFTSRKQRDEVIDRLKSAVLAVSVSGVAISDPSHSAPSGTGQSPSLHAHHSYSSTVSSVASAHSTVPTTPERILSINTSPSAIPSSTTAAPYTMSPLRTSSDALPKPAYALGQNLEEHVNVPAGMPLPVMPKVLGTQSRRKVSGLRFVCLTIGSRGDVQPYVALGQELMKDGNRVTIASHPEYREWVEGFGLDYQEVGGDPAALMKLSVEHKMFSPGFFKESLGHFRQWLDNLFHESWLACQDADILIESPSTMAGIHVAEALGIPYFRAFTMPWTTTSTYPQAFAAGVDLGPTYNQLSYTLFDSIIWKATAGQVNKWRKNELGLKPTSEKKMSQAKVPFVYNFSSAVVPKPNDWRDHIFISGYWFLEDTKPWDPPPSLMDFIAKARADGKPIIYIGFGSIVVPDAAAMTRAVANAVVGADVRAILSKGWSERGSDKVEEVELPEEIYSVLSIPHDHLFPLIDAACHHGGAGSTGASLRAGLPTLIHPFFGDQYFWASRVQKLGCGLQIHSLAEKELTAAFKRGTSDRVMKEKAEAIGKKIQAENGPRAALDFIYDHVHLAQHRSSTRAARAAGTPLPKAAAHPKSSFLPSSLTRSSSGSRERTPQRSSTLPVGGAAPHPAGQERTATGLSALCPMSR